MNIKKILENERMLKASVGLDAKEFQDLLESFSQILKEEQEKKKNRQRKRGGGAKGRIKLPEQKLFYILLYLKVYPTFDLAAVLFDSSKSRTHGWYQKILPILEKTRGRKCLLPKRQITSMKEFLSAFPELKDLFIDGTERPVQRPKNPKNQKKNYSGKKKGHTRKNIIACDEKKKILFLSPTKSGKIHDKKALDKTIFLDFVPPDITLWQDTGFQGTHHKHPNTMMPKKNTKKTKLTPEEKAENKTISGIRILVEHAIGGIKRYNAVHQILRNKNGIDDTFMNVCCGLWNFHLQMK